MLVIKRFLDFFCIYNVFLVFFYLKDGDRIDFPRGGNRIEYMDRAGYYTQSGQQYCGVNFFAKKCGNINASRLYIRNTQ